MLLVSVVFQEELLHFEHRLSKQAFYQQQLQQAAEALQEDEDASERHRNLEEKAQNFGRKVSYHIQFIVELIL